MLKPKLPLTFSWLFQPFFSILQPSAFSWLLLDAHVPTLFRKMICPLFMLQVLQLLAPQVQPFFPLLVSPPAPPSYPHSPFTHSWTSMSLFHSHPCTISGHFHSHHQVFFPEPTFGVLTPMAFCLQPASVFCGAVRPFFGFCSWIESIRQLTPSRLVVRPRLRRFLLHLSFFEVPIEILKELRA
jgi:hypothetical protein